MKRFLGILACLLTLAALASGIEDVRGSGVSEAQFDPYVAKLAPGAACTTRINPSIGYGTQSYQLYVRNTAGDSSIITTYLHYSLTGIPGSHVADPDSAMAVDTLVGTDWGRGCQYSDYLTASWDSYLVHYNAGPDTARFLQSHILRTFSK